MKVSFCSFKRSPHTIPGKLVQISPRVNRTNLECGELYVQALAAMPGCAAQVRALGSGWSRRVSTSLNINDLEIVVFDVFVVSHNIDHVDPFASFDLSVAGAANVSLMDAVMNQWNYMQIHYDPFEQIWTCSSMIFNVGWSYQKSCHVLGPHTCVLTGMSGSFLGAQERGKTTLVLFLLCFPGFPDVCCMLILCLAWSKGSTLAESDTLALLRFWAPVMSADVTIEADGAVSSSERHVRCDWVSRTWKNQTQRQYPWRSWGWALLKGFIPGQLLPFSSWDAMIS